jgi:hypothetical protein
MFAKIYIQAALKKTWAQDTSPGKIFRNKINHQDSLTSLLIHDIFGGEILKTRQENDWYFYNRINGERLDFNGSGLKKEPEDSFFEDLPANPDEPYNYFASEDYSNQYIKFIHAYEAAVGQ